jgi:hypothetical protein
VAAGRCGRAWQTSAAGRGAPGPSRADGRSEIARREHLELDPGVRWLITQPGRDALARAEAWLFGPGQTVAQASPVALEPAA